MNTPKKYNIHYQFGNGAIFTNIPFQKVKSVFMRLIKSCHKKDLPDFKFFEIRETTGTSPVVFYPKNGVFLGINAIRNPQSKIAIAKMFHEGNALLEKIRNSNKKENV